MKKTFLSMVLLMAASVLSLSAADTESIYVQKVDFESGQLPEGWTQEFVGSDVYGEHPWTIEKAEDADYPKSVQENGEYILSLRNNTQSTIGYTTRLISPVMDLSQNKVFQPILVFSHAQQQRSGDFDQLKVYYRSQANDNWVRLDGRNGNPEFNKKITKWQKDTIQLTSQSETYQVMFEVTDRFGRGVVLDNIEVRPMPTCENPYGFVVSGLTTTSATVSWNASFDTDSFEVVLSKSEIESIETVDPADIVYAGFLTDDQFAFSTTDLDITLSRNKTYYLYVRSYCQQTVSDWSNESFRTKNFADLPLKQFFTAGEDFEYKSGSVSHISYWSFGTSIKRDDGVTMEYMPFVNTNTEPGTSTAGQYAYDQNFCLAFTGARSLGTDIPAGQYVYAATPELNVANLNDVFVSFWGTAYQSVGDNYASGIIVGVMTDPEDFTTFEAIDTCYIYGSQEFNKFGVSLAKYQGEGKYVAFASDFKDKNNRFYIDNIVIKQSDAPIWPSDIKISKVSAKGFDLTLDAHGLPYNVLVTKRVTNSKGQIVEDPAEMEESDKLLSVLNQTASTIHVDMPEGTSGLMLEVFTQAVGNGGVAGDWSLPAMTRLPMFLDNSMMPYRIDWEDTQNTWSERTLYPFSNNGVTYNYPNSIITATLTAPNGYGQNKSYTALSSGTTSQEGKSTGHYIYMRKEGNRVTTGDPAIYGYTHKYGNYIALPEVEDLSKVLLKFYMKRYSSSVENSSRVAVGILTDPYDISTFDTIATFEATSATEYQPFSCSFEKYKGEGKIIAIQAVESDNPYESGSLSGSGYGWAYVYYSNQYLDWINIYPLGECNPISNPKVEVSHNSATISWGANGMSKWQIRIKDSKDELLVDQIVEQTTFVANNLQPHSEYTYMVSPECDTEYELSDWLSFTTECVPENPLPFVEDFENPEYKTGSSTGFIPYCWSAPKYVYNGGHEGESNSYYPYITRGSSYGHSSASAFVLYTNTSSTVQNQIWTALPVMAAPVKELQVEFYVKGYSTTQNSMLQVGVMTDPNDITTFEVVDSVNVVGTAWKGALVKFDKYEGAGKYIAFKRNYERDGKSCHYYLDDIAVNYIQDCEKLFALSTSDPTVNGATFTWSKTNADKYEVLVLKENINPNSADTTGKRISAQETNQTSLIFRNDALELNKIYYAYVRTICGVTPTTWSESASFRTTCLAQTPEVYGVEDFSEATVLGCWTLGCMNGTSIPTRYGSETGKFRFLLRIYNTTSTDGAYAIMPPLDVEDISKYQITFDACTNSTTASNVKSITVGIISNASDLSTFAPITTITGLNYTTDSTGLFTYTIPFDSYDGDYVTGAKGKQVMFLSESGENYNEAFIDNIRFDLIPACAAPSTIIADSLSDTYARFKWNNTGAAYELAVTETKVAPNEAKAKVVNIVKNIVDTVASVDGLKMLTNYYVYVRTICGEADTSAWSNARLFTTTCPPFYSLPYTEDFEKCASGTKNHPSCWVSYTDSKGTITENENASYPYTTTGGNNGSTRALYMYSSAATSYVLSYTAMPQMDVDLKKAMLSFWYKANAAATSSAPNRKMVVGIADEVETLDTLLATFQPLDTIITTVATYAKYSCIISEKYNGSGKYIVFIGFGGNGASSYGGVYVDDVEVSLVPTCFKPDNLSVGNMYDTSAKLSWEQLQGDNTKWDVAYGLKDAEIANMTILQADTNVFVVEGLLPSTTYDFYVRANCGVDDLSEWRGPVTATTLYQIPLADAKWTFENGEPRKAQAPTGSNKIPLTWMVNNVWTGLATVGNAPYLNGNTKTNGLVTARRAYSGDSVMYFYSNTTAHPGYGPYAVLPVIEDADYDNLQISFMARDLYITPSKVNDAVDSVIYTTYASGSYKHTIYVGVATDPYDMSTFEELTKYVLPEVTEKDATKAVDPEGTNWWREVVVPLYGAKGKYIILAGPGDYNTVWVDDVTVEAVDPNACTNVTKLALDKATLKYNTAEFNWLSPKSSFKVTITEKGKAEPYATSVVNTSSYKIETLEAQTAYTISVQTVCGEDLSKAVTLDFTTPCKPADEAEAYWNFTDNLYQWGTSATYVIPECWEEGIGVGAATNAPYVISNSTTYTYARGEAVTDRSLRFYSTASIYNTYAVLPELGFELDSMKLHFWGRAAYFYWRNHTTNSNKNKLYAKNSTYSRTLIVGVMSDPADIETFVPMDTITYDQIWEANAGVYAYNDPTGNEYWQEYALPLAKYAGKGRIALVAPQPTAASYFFVDDLEIIKGDFCLPVTGQRAENVTSTSAMIRWSALTENENVQVQVATNEEFAAAAIVYDQKIKDQAFADINNLTPGTTYFFRLKHICNEAGGEESEWGTTGMFTTDYVVRFNEDFNAVKTTMPKNWWRSNSATVEEVFSGEKVLTEASATASYDWRVNIGSNQQIYANLTTNNASSSSTSSAKHWLISPEIDLSANADDQLLLSFDIALRAQSSNIPNPNTDVLEKFIVVVSTDDGNTWKEENATIWSTDADDEYNFNQFYANGNFLTKYIDFSKYAGQTIRVAFYIYSYTDKQVQGSKNIVLLDNIQLNQYELVTNSDNICRWEDYEGYNFDIDADQLPAGTNSFERFTPAKKNDVKDLIERLTIEVEDESVNTLSGVTLCEGDEYNENDFNFVATKTGVYKRKLQSAIGCDSTVVLNVTVNPKQYTDIVETICQGSYYEFNGEKYYTSTNKTETFPSLVTGCDSIVTLHLTVSEILTGETLKVYLCPGQTYDFTEKYQALSEDGVYADTVINARGCDSIAAVEIINVKESYVFFRAAICEGEVYDEGLFGGLRNPGDYSTPHGEQGLKNIYGCDSIVTLHLLVAKPNTTTQTYELSDTVSSTNLPYVLNGQELLPVGTGRGQYTRTITLGCGEAVITINVDHADAVDNIFANSLALEPNLVGVGQPVQVVGTFSNAEVEVITATGAVAFRQQYNGQITLPGMPTAGIYLVRLTDATGVYNAKLVVK